MQKYTLYGHFTEAGIGNQPWQMSGFGCVDIYRKLILPLTGDQHFHAIELHLPLFFKKISISLLDKTHGKQGRNNVRCNNSSLFDKCCPLGTVFSLVCWQLWWLMINLCVFLFVSENTCTVHVWILRLKCRMTVSFQDLSRIPSDMLAKPRSAAVDVLSWHKVERLDQPHTTSVMCWLATTHWTLPCRWSSFLWLLLS